MAVLTLALIEKLNIWDTDSNIWLIFGATRKWNTRMASVAPILKSLNCMLFGFGNLGLDWKHASEWKPAHVNRATHCSCTSVTPVYLRPPLSDHYCHLLFRNLNTTQILFVKRLRVGRTGKKNILVLLENLLGGNVSSMLSLRLGYY